MSDKITRRLLRRTLGSGAFLNPTFTLYPVTSGVPATGTTLTSKAGAWGNYADIIANNAIGVPFWLMQVMYDTPPGAVAFAVQIYNANANMLVTVFEDQIDVAAGNCNLAPTVIPIPVWCNIGNQIQGRVGRGTAVAINTSLLVATGL